MTNIGVNYYLFILLLSSLTVLLTIISLHDFITFFPKHTRKFVPWVRSARRRLDVASSWSWRRWKHKWISSLLETLCPGFAPTLASQPSLKRLPHTSLARLLISTLFRAGHPSLWLLQLSTWPLRWVLGLFGVCIPICRMYEVPIRHLS